ncbi:DUF1993 domain-containing protein [Bowmanella denitrificans]|uniref:DUF1993 domain-containing protein n=1 Tax=Bowmanella denitrificans TaxID=366582 RepID=UPI000C9B631E|nr:DUF1993 domain-containing protein [Bowmanella denitrificans]
MSLSMFNASIPLLMQGLNNLLVILGKAETFAEQKKVASDVMAASRLAIDMVPLTRQVQIACDTAKGCGARLSGQDNPSFADDETNLQELQARVRKTLAFLEQLHAEQFEGSEDKAIVLNFPSITLNFNGQDYLTQFVLPNFYFHLTTAYGILRHIGVDLGKRDYLGKVGGV